MLTDTHCHLDLEQFDADRGEVIERAAQAGLTRILIPGLDLPSSRRAVDLAESHPMLFAAVGVHPTESLSWNSEKRDGLEALARADPALSPAAGAALSLSKSEGKVVAIGEIGLDYYWDSAPHDRQQTVLREQLDLAAELALPVVIHLREKGDAPDGDCAEDLLAILARWVRKLQGGQHPLAERPGVLHSFSGSLASARKASDLGFYIGVTGPVTYKNADAKREVIRQVPLEKLLIETDGPYLAPVPQRGRRNEPAFVRHIADKIAELHHISPEEAANVTTENAKRLFGWGQ
jgi:TatD DNase family protein